MTRRRRPGSRHRTSWPRDLPTVPLVHSKPPAAAKAYVKGFLGAGNLNEPLDVRLAGQVGSTRITRPIPPEPTRFRGNVSSRGQRHRVIKYIVRRLLGAIPVLFGLSIILFAFVHLLPGDPVTSLLGQHATPELRVEILKQLGLDRPLYEQYLLYIGQLASGDLGKSIINNRTVVEELALRFPATIELTLGALLFAVGLGIPLGRLAARHAQGWPDGARDRDLAARDLDPDLRPRPTAPVHLRRPAQDPAGVRAGSIRACTSSCATNFVLIDSLLTGNIDAFVDALKHLILPAIALGSIPLAIITRITRASVLDVNNEDYVRTARAKGLTESRVDSRHIMRNAWLPVVTVIGLQVGGLLAGAVITETVFAWPGVGRYIVERDPGPRLPRRPVGDPRLRPHLPGGEPGGRHRLRVPQPADPVLLMATATARVPARAPARASARDLARRAEPADAQPAGARRAGDHRDLHRRRDPRPDPRPV